MPALPLIYETIQFSPYFGCEDPDLPAQILAYFRARRAADLVVFAMGFVHTEHSALVTDFGLELNPGACLLTDAELMTSAPGVFAAGDCVLGARLIVTAIDQGRRAAAAADRWLRGR